jgi:hypothetical protein
MSPEAIRELRAIARRQLGLFTLAQSLDAGWSRSTIRRWLHHGWWHEVAPRVYESCPAAPLTWRPRLLAATLSTDAVAARRSAAALYGLLPRPDAPELLVARGKRNLDRSVVHSTIELPDSDLTFVGPIPATTPIRTLIDVCGDLDRAPATDLVDRAIARGLVRPIRLERRARELAAPARTGATRVLKAIATSHPELERARNRWEARVLRLIRSFDLPEPIPNFSVRVGGANRVLDFAWSAARASLEFDGYGPHVDTPRVFDDDRVRQNALIADGWVVYRVTSTMLSRQAFAPIARAVAERLVSHQSAISDIAV